jgi:hypothetical protein
MDDDLLLGVYLILIASLVDKSIGLEARKRLTSDTLIVRVYGLMSACQQEECYVVVEL